MNRTFRTFLVGVLLLGLAVVTVHQRLRVTFLGYELRRVHAELKSLQAEQHRLELKAARDQA